MNSWNKFDNLGRAVISGINTATTSTKTIQTRLLLGQTTLTSSSSFDFDLSSGDALSCDHLEIVCVLRGTVSANIDFVYLIYNSDTTSTNYRRERIGGANTALGAGAMVADMDSTPFVGVVSASTATANYFGHITIQIPEFRNTSRQKLAIANYGQLSTVTEARVGVVHHQWLNTSAITNVKIRTDNHPTDLFASGSSVWVYGVTELSVVTGVTIT